MSSPNVLTNLSMNTDIFPLLICSSLATLVSNLISLSSQNVLIGALENSLSAVKPFICPTSFLKSSQVFSETSARFSFLLFVINLKRVGGCCYLVSIFFIYCGVNLAYFLIF